MTNEIETVAYQANHAARHRPCGAHPCMNEFPGMPSRWCSGCLIAALLVEPRTPALVVAVDRYMAAKGRDDAEWAAAFNELMRALADAKRAA